LTNVIVNLFVTLHALLGNTIHVPADVPTIQGAIVAASNGDRVLVSPGTYFERLDFLGKAITVESEAGPLTTVVDAGGVGNVVIFKSNETASSVLRDLTLRNGAGVAPFGDGGGVRIQGASPTIEGNVIRDNVTCGAGGGIMCQGGSPTIRGNHIVNNKQMGCSGGTGGGGIACAGTTAPKILDNTLQNNSHGSFGGGISLFAAGTPLIRGNRIQNNTAGPQGGGVYIVNSSNATIVNNVFVANKAGSGGGIYYLVPSGQMGPQIEGNTFADNDGALGSGIFSDGFDSQARIIGNIVVAKAGQSGIHCGTFNPGLPVMQFNDVVSQGAPPYSGASPDQTGVNGNISANPQFVNPPAGDFGLQPGSPCIDKGDPQTQLAGKDIAGFPRVLNGVFDRRTVIDMGAHEFSHIRLTAGFAPMGGDLQVNLSIQGLPGLFVILYEGYLPGETPFPPFGTFFFDLNHHASIVALTSIPDVKQFRYAMAPGVGPVYLQAIGYDPVSGWGNVSNAIEVKFP
jgi:parallel beta-helix repeat protein